MGGVPFGCVTFDWDLTYGTPLLARAAVAQVWISSGQQWTDGSREPLELQTPFKSAAPVESVQQVDGTRKFRSRSFRLAVLRASNSRYVHVGPGVWGSGLGPIPVGPIRGHYVCILVLISSTCII